MIVWGGTTNGPATFGDGATYSPAANAWTILATTGAPAGRIDHTAVWTGSEMIIWGGAGSISAFNDGARYRATTGA